MSKRDDEQFCPEHKSLCEKVDGVKEAVDDIAKNHLPHLTQDLSEVKLKVGLLRRDLWWIMLLGAALAGFVFRVLGILK